MALALIMPTWWKPFGRKVQKVSDVFKTTKFLDDPTISMPPTSSVWKNTKGAVRTVSDVDEVWVHYRRPAPAPVDLMTVTGGAWHSWVEQTGAVRMK